MNTRIIDDLQLQVDAQERDLLRAETKIKSLESQLAAAKAEAQNFKDIVDMIKVVASDDAEMIASVVRSLFQKSVSPAPTTTTSTSGNNNNVPVTAPTTTTTVTSKDKYERCGIEFTNDEISSILLKAYQLRIPSNDLITEAIKHSCKDSAAITKYVELKK
jgi:prolyl-tRNA synthetase